jgi:hypothetical protein
MLARLRLASSIRSATIFNVDPHKSVPPEESRVPDYVATHWVLQATKQPLTQDLTASFVKWLRNADGFDDKIFKRCARAPTVGLLLATSAPHAAQGTTEIIVDFACNSMGFATMEGRGRVWTEVHFDPSRAELLSIVRRGLPHDKQLQTLR